MSVTVRSDVIAAELAYAQQFVADAPTFEVTVDSKQAVDMKSGDATERLAVYTALFGEKSSIVGGEDGFLNKGIIDGLKTWGKLSKKFQNITADSPFNKLRGLFGKVGTMALKSPFLAGSAVTLLDAMFFSMLKARFSTLTKEEMLAVSDASRWFNFMQHNLGEEVCTVPMDAPKPKKKVPVVKDGEGKAKKAKKAPVDTKAIDVSRVEIRVGQLVEVGPHPNADSLYSGKVDVGEESGPRLVCMGLKKFVPVEELQGRRVVVVCNLKPANMRGIKSAAMIMAASNEDHSIVKLCNPPADVPVGTRITATGFEGAPDAKLTGKKKIFDTVKESLTSNAEGVCCYNNLPLLAAGKPCTTELISSHLG